MEKQVSLKSSLTREEFFLNIEQASKSERFVNLFVDMIAIYILWVFVSLFWFLLQDAYSSMVYAPNYESLSIVVAPFALALSVVLGYFIGMESMYGKTIGKMITKTKVVSLDGSKPSFNQIVGRSFARLIPIEPISYLILPEGWHGSWSETIVVKEQRN